MARTMKPADGKAPTQRQLRVGEELRHILASLVERGEVLDSIGNPIAVTITEVRITPDLRHAKVFVIPLEQSTTAPRPKKAVNGKQQEQTQLDVLAGATKFLRREIAKRVTFKYVPDLRFFYDHSFDSAAKIEALLSRPEVARDLVKRPESEMDPV